MTPGLAANDGDEMMGEATEVFEVEEAHGEDEQPALWRFGLNWSWLFNCLGYENQDEANDWS